MPSRCGSAFRLGVHLDQPAHASGLIDQHALAGPGHDLAESIDLACICCQRIPISTLEKPHDVESVAPPLLGALISSVEPSVELACNEWQPARHWDGDLEVLAPNVDIGGQAGRCPVPGDEEAVLVVEVGGARSRVEDLDDLELHAFDDPPVIIVARGAEGDEGLVCI